MTRSDTLAARCRRLRTRAALSQRELARRAGLGHGTVAKIEDGSRGKRPTYNVLQKLAAALGVPLGKLVE